MIFTDVSMQIRETEAKNRADLEESRRQQLWEKERQLREKERQLREKERQLREKEGRLWEEKQQKERRFLEENLFASKDMYYVILCPR